jgi:hypothetical protein
MNIVRAKQQFHPFISPGNPKYKILPEAGAFVNCNLLTLNQSGNSLH